MDKSEIKKIELLSLALRHRLTEAVLPRYIRFPRD
jgi:hypothetical protein